LARAGLARKRQQGVWLKDRRDGNIQDITLDILKVIYWPGSRRKSPSFNAIDSDDSADGMALWMKSCDILMAYKSLYRSCPATCSLSGMSSTRTYVTAMLDVWILGRSQETDYEADTVWKIDRSNIRLQRLFKDHFELELITIP
jgi:hypothetical protein